MTHALRNRLLAIALALGGTQVAPFVHMAFAQVDPPLTPLPYTQVIRIGDPTVCPECPPIVCPGLPFPVFLAGSFPNGCYRLDGVTLVNSDSLTNRLPMPIVQVEVTRRFCGACTQNTPQWSGEVIMPAGLDPGIYTLPLQLLLHTTGCDTTIVADTTYHAIKNFVVQDSCPGVPPPPGNDSCFFASWKQSTTDMCDAFIRPGGSASVDMTVGTSVALAGLQGTIQLYPPGLRISDLQPIGPAAGMRIAWTQQNDGGARFVMFAESGAPIPITDGPLPGTPVLRVTASATNRVPLPGRTNVSVYALTASSMLGNGVPLCPILFAIVDAATICAGGGCDVNHDGVADVLDLVRMVHCVLGTGSCPDSIGAPDCNADGARNLDDVLCCARQILHADPPDSLVGRPEPGVGVTFGVPERTASGVDLPVRLTGANRVGAARLAFDYPDGRFTVASVERRGSDNWLDLFEAADGRLVVGLIALPSAEAVIEQAVDLVIHLTRAPGAPAGGEIRLANGEFSGRDGVRLEIEMVQAPVPLEATGLALSAGRPNPFGSSTRFAVTLPRDAHGAVQIYDLGGRLVKTLANGPMAAGTSEYRWDGTDRDGRTVPDGLYFAKVRAGGEVGTQKLMFLRGR